VKRRGKILKPSRLDDHIVIRKSQDVAPSLANSCVEGIRLARLRLKQMAEAAGISAAKIVDYLSGLVAAIVVHNQNFPLDRLWHG
jgi:hypothetical protein